MPKSSAMVHKNVSFADALQNRLSISGRGGDFDSTFKIDLSKTIITNPITNSQPNLINVINSNETVDKSIDIITNKIFESINRLILPKLNRLENLIGENSNRIKNIYSFTYETETDHFNESQSKNGYKQFTN